MTVIEIKPHRWGWKVFEAPGVEPVFQQKDQAIGYAETRAGAFAPVRFVFWIRKASSNAPLRSARRIESWDDTRRIRTAAARGKKHFAMCAKCCEIFDRRSLDEVLFHTDH